MKGVSFALLAAALAAGFLIPFKAAAESAPRGAIVVGLLAIAALLNTLAAPLRASGRRRPSAASWRAAFVLAIFSVSGNVGMASALAVQKAAVASVFLQSQVLIVAALGWVLLKERVDARFAFGVVFAIAGFIITNLPSAEGEVVVSGVIWVLVAATSFAIMQVYTRKVIENIEPVVVNALRLWMASAFFLAWPGNISELLGMSGTNWALVAAAAFLGPFLSRLCLMEAVRHATAAAVALIVMVQPVCAAILGFLFFRSVPTALEFGGGALILVGVSIPQLLGRGRAPAAPD